VSAGLVFGLVYCLAYRVGFNIGHGPDTFLPLERHVQPHVHGFAVLLVLIATCVPMGLLWAGTETMHPGRNKPPDQRSTARTLFMAILWIVVALGTCLLLIMAANPL
jgi:hypothetical protein